MRNTMVEELVKLAEKDKDVVLMVGDLGFGCFEPFWEQFPDRFINAGISEQNMASMAAGLAKEGKKVYFYSIANFPSLRCLEQIRNDICYHKLDVKIISIGSGFEYGSLGMSHHATEDLSIMRCLPEMEVYCPCNKEQVANVLNSTHGNGKPAYIKLNKQNISDLYDFSRDLEIEKVRDGKRLAVLSTGLIVKDAIELADELKDIAVYHICKCNQLNETKIVEVLKSYEKVVTLEENNENGGLGEAVAKIIATNQDLHTKLNIVAIKNTYASDVGNREYLKNVYKVDKKELKRVVDLCLK